MLKHVTRVALIALLLGGLLAACGSDDDNSSGTTDTTEASSEASKVTIKTLEYSYSLPSTTFKGGLVELTIDNSAAKEPHEAELVRLDAGKKLADVKAASSAEGPPPTWLHPAGGSGPIDPGKKAVYTGNLEAGTYVLQCHLPAPDGKDHLEKGMISEVTVTAGDEGELPESDVTLGAEDFKFTGVEDLKAGEQVVRFENTGKEPHHAAIIGLAPGKTSKDALAFFAATAAPAGPPPFTGFPGLFATSAPGASATRTSELTPGNYMIVCFIPSADGTPHAAKGMVAEFTIK